GGRPAGGWGWPPRVSSESTERRCRTRRSTPNGCGPPWVETAYDGLFGDRATLARAVGPHAPSDRNRVPRPAARRREAILGVRAVGLLVLAPRDGRADVLHGGGRPLQLSVRRAHPQHPASEPA